MTRLEALAIVEDPESGFNKGTLEWGEMSDLVFALAGDMTETPIEEPVRILIRAEFASKAAMWRWIGAMEASEDVLGLETKAR